MNYSEATEYLYGLQRFGIKLGLEGITSLLDRIGRPQDSLRFIHVGGTNGKGSVCTFAASVLRHAGHSIGVNTSPHLRSFTERITIDGVPISEDDVTGLVEMIRPHVTRAGRCDGRGHPTYFEVVTAMALHHFARVGVDYVCLEVGLGGTYDATNVVRPEVTVITKISRDHTDHLGPSITSIAQNKAGIIKPGGVLITDRQHYRAAEVIRRTCSERSCRLIELGREIHCERADGADPAGPERFHFQGRRKQLRELEIGLIGAHQAANAALALGAVEELLGEIPEEAARAGLREARWPGRLDRVRERPDVLLDCAHNESAARSLSRELRRFPRQRLILVLGLCVEKESRPVVRILADLADEVIATQAGIDRAKDAADLAAEVRRRNQAVSVEPRVAAAVEQALRRANPDDLVLITGSIFVVGEAMEALGVETGRA